MWVRDKTKLAASVLKTLTVERLMTSEVFSVTLDMTLREVIKVLTTHRVSGAPIIDFELRVVSVISEGDIIKLMPGLGVEVTVESCLGKLCRTDKLITLNKNDSLIEAFRIFMKTPVHRIIISDDTGKLQGILSRSNLLGMFAENAVGQAEA